MNESMQQQLQRYITQSFPDKKTPQVGELTNLSAGWESDVHAFTLTHGAGQDQSAEELVLRIYQGDDAPAKSIREFQGMQWLHRAGYPIPQVLVLERKHSPFGKPVVIMERIDGQMLWPLWFSASEQRQGELLTQFCQLLVNLHTLDWRPYIDAKDVTQVEQDSPYLFIDRFLELARQFLADSSNSGFAPYLTWLQERRDRVPCHQPAPIHWDFHPANVLLCEDGSAVVIDWTQIEISDARFDLAWTLLLVGTQENPQWRGRILHEYERLAGSKIEEIEYFEVIACIKRLASVAMVLSGNADKVGMRSDAADMIREQLGSMREVYRILVERTGIAVPEIEELLS